MGPGATDGATDSAGTLLAAPESARLERAGPEGEGGWDAPASAYGSKATPAAPPRTAARAVLIWRALFRTKSPPLPLP